MSKVVVITGASSGIGASLAKILGAQGNLLALAARRLKEPQQVAAASHPRALAVATDVTQRDEVNNLRDVALRSFEHVDVWINNAGRGINRGVLDLTDEDFTEAKTSCKPSSQMGKRGTNVSRKVYYTCFMTPFSL